jgi:protein phosphatase 2C family protein 2/3
VLKREPSDFIYHTKEQNPLPNFKPAMYSTKPHALIHSFAANTHQGISRNYNEDRVSIIMNISKPPDHKSTKWPVCSFFAIYDGHGGVACADYLKD